MERVVVEARPFDLAGASGCSHGRTLREPIDRHRNGLVGFLVSLDEVLEGVNRGWREVLLSTPMADLGGDLFDQVDSLTPRLCVCDALCPEGSPSIEQCSRSCFIAIASLS